MPYVKRINSNVTESYEVENLMIDLIGKQINVQIRQVTIASTGIPRTNVVSATIKDENKMILDPAWDANSTPPKPIGFLESDANTWNGIDPANFPRVLDASRQLFSLCIGTDSPGVNMYARIKSMIYTVLVTAGNLPDQSAGFNIE